MKKGTRKKTFYEWFVEVDQWFAERNYTQTLAVLADGIEAHPDWVKYIRENQNRYRIELHGHTHVNYRGLSEAEGFLHLYDAKKKLEDTFGVKVTRMYFPFARLGFPEWGIRVCNRLGIGFHNRFCLVPHFYYHYWNTRSVRKIKWIVEKNLAGEVLDPRVRQLKPKWLPTQELN